MVFVSFGNRFVGLVVMSDQSCPSVSTQLSELVVTFQDVCFLYNIVVQKGTSMINESCDVYCLLQYQ